MVPFMNLLIKPASGMCNLRCRYCFYADETQKRQVVSYGIMSEQILSNVIRKALENTGRACAFAFQGGEPTLAGLEFFQKAVALAKEYNTGRRAVQFSIQTNGTLLDEAWCRFFAENRFLVGVSLDGTKELHDRNRIDAAGAGTYGRVVGALRLLEAHRVDFNILTVLTPGTCRNFRKVYQHYKRNGWDYQQYIPCLDPLGEERGGHPWSLTPERYGQYLKTAFDCWYQDAMAGQKTYHRYFDNLLLMMNGQPPEACGMRGICGAQYVVEADGSVYPCDFYTLDAYRLGNLNTDGFPELEEKRRALGFIQQSARLEPACASCQWRGLCAGGCRRDRDYFEAGLGKNYYCAAYREFFEYAWPGLRELYRRLTGRAPIL